MLNAEIQSNINCVQPWRCPLLGLWVEVNLRRLNGVPAQALSLVTLPLPFLFELVQPGGLAARGWFFIVDDCH